MSNIQKTGQVQINNMDERKEYWVRIYIRKCLLLKDLQTKLDFHFKWCENSYNAPEEKIEELKKKYTIDEYINRLIPVIDKHLSKEEIKEAIRFYSTDVGRKLLDAVYLQDLGKVGLNWENQVEQQFTYYKNKK